MPLEIERRWLIEDDVQAMLDEVVDQEKIEQSYLVDTGGWVQRIRVAIPTGLPAKHYLTMKRPAGGFANHEIEVEISREAFREFEAHTGPTLIKQRYRIPHGDLVLEIDVFRNFKLIGLVIAEVELPNADHPFTPPAWFGREITGDRLYSNFSLARVLRDELKLDPPPFPTPEFKKPPVDRWVKVGGWQPQGDWPMVPRKVASEADKLRARGIDPDTVGMSMDQMVEHYAVMGFLSDQKSGQHVGETWMEQPETTKAYYRSREHPQNPSYW